MKIETPFLPALFIFATDILVRAAAEGVPQALVSKAVDFSLKQVKAAHRDFEQPISGIHDA
jgi:hypothetical protein